MNWIGKYWVEWAFGLVGVALFAGGRYLKGVHCKQTAVEKGVQALLRAQIIQNYNEYMAREYCPIYALENVHALFREYKALGGNGPIERLVEEMNELPHIKQPA